MDQETVITTEPGESQGVCKTCKQMFPYTTEFWYIYKGKWWRARCKACVKKHNAKYRVLHPYQKKGS